MLEKEINTPTSVKRPYEIGLSLSYMNAKGGFFAGSLMLLWALGLGLLAYYNGEEMMQGEAPISIIYRFIFVLASASLGFIIPSLINTARPPNPLTYSPMTIGLKTIFLSLWAMLVIGTFLSIFTTFANKPDSYWVKYLIWFFAVIMGVVFTYRIYLGLANCFTALRYGKSYLEIISNTRPKLGDTITIRFENPDAVNTTQEVDVYLRNIHEFWNHNAKKKEHRANNGLVSQVLFQSHQNLNLSGTGGQCNLTIPASGQVTDYEMIAPTYWEVEVSDKRVGFFSRFVINIEV